MDDFKTYVSRTLNTEDTQYQNVIWQAGKPPLDSELNLMGQLATDNQAKLVRTQTHSGVLIDPRSAERDYIFNRLWSNYLKVRPFTAIVNGLVVNVEELDIKLPPPPATGARSDFVFLEVWNTIISADGSNHPITNKPTSTTIYRNGNVDGVNTINDEMVDGAVGFETTKRVQTQYQVRVVSGVDLKSNPEGISSPLVTAVGPTNGAGNVVFTHVEGDAGLWSASVVDDSLSENTIYAIPLCTLFRRNGEPYKDVSSSGGPNQNGASNRKPSSLSTEDAVQLTQSTLSVDISRSQLGNVVVNNLIGSGLDDPNLFLAGSRFFVIGHGLNNEIVKVSGVDALTNEIVLEQRGVGGTQAKYHTADTTVGLFNSRPDKKFADEIHPDDLLDMRHAVTMGEWDYQSLLECAVSDLLFGKLKTSYKQNSENAFCKGVVVEEVSYLSSVAANRTHQMDYPNGFRDTWSDASFPQMGLTLYLNPSVPTDNSGLSTENLDVSNQNEWEIGPDLSPSAFLFNAVPLKTASVIFLTLDGVLDNLGYGIKGNNIQDKGIRFISPREIGTQDNSKAPPFSIEQLGSEHENFSYPTLSSNFERPFIVLGRARDSQGFTTNVSDPSQNNHNYAVLYKKTAYLDSEMSIRQGITQTNYDEVIALQLNALNLSSEDIALISPNNPNAFTGEDSNLYAIVYGDPNVASRNNGVYKVISVSGYFDTSDYFVDQFNTTWNPSGGTANTVILEAIDDFSARLGTLDHGIDLRVEFRSQIITELDDNIAIAITESDLASASLYTSNEFQLSVSVLYPPALGATANLAENIHKIGITPPNRDHFLNNARSDKDTANASALPLVSGEIDLPVSNHISIWNRLPSSNLPTGWSPETSLGGNVVNEESDRESEVFKDQGSKTLVLRPFQKKQVILHQHQSNSDMIPTIYQNGISVDGGALFIKRGAYKLPEALVPRFGRQDIPLHTRTSSSDSFLNGLNHIFSDKVSVSDEVFNIVGGVSNNGNQGVEPVLFDTLGNYGEYSQSLANVNAIGVRKREEGGLAANRTNPLSVPTSDFGTTLQGIELPPYFGVARIYGVYDRDAYIAHIVGNGNTSGHNSERLLPIDSVTDGSCPNLLRTDSSAFTLYLNRNGGNLDVNDPSFTGAHTYVLTEHAIDITRSPNYNNTKSFNDFEFVVEAVVFGFADGFITENRNVLVRNYNGSGTLRNSADVSKISIDSVIPFAPPQGSKISVAYQRVVYQGDPFFTKGVNILDDFDQTIPYGRKSVSDLTLGSRDQDTVEFLNRRNLQVLASLDFYTTLGTGKIGGVVYPTTVTDIGYGERKPFRNPSLYNGSYPSTLMNTFTQPSLKGGFATVFFFSNNDAFIKYANATFTFTNSKETFTHSLAGEAESFSASFNLITALESKGYEAIQITGSYTHDGQQYNYIGVIIREPYSDYNTSVSLDVRFAGRDLQLFEGIREIPMSFNYYDTINAGSVEQAQNLPNRTKTSVRFSSAEYNPVNAGNGNTPISLVGVTSRLPLGSLVRDSDFLCEDILNNQSSYLFSSTGNLSTLSNSIPVNPQGLPYTRSVGVSGEVLQMTEGDLSQSTPLAESNNFYSIARGSGAIFGASGQIPGSPFSFLATSLSESSKPVLKGSALACRAMLVKNFTEEFQGNVRTHGDELQLLIVTYCIDGATRSPLEINSNGQLSLGGEISPTGYGEGFASADRYRIKGRPLVKNHSYPANLDITPAPYNSGE